MKCLCDKKKLMLPHKVTLGLNIHNDKWVFDPKWKAHDIQPWIKHDINHQSTLRSCKVLNSQERAYPDIFQK
jgi:hypothetical protein